MFKEKNIKSIVPYIVLIFFAFLLSLMTWFRPFSSGVFGHDAGFFAYIGYALNNGRIIYAEILDSKGPFVYVFYMIGIMINHYHGLWVIDLITLVIALLFAYKTALLISENNQWIAIVSVLFSALLLVVTLEGGSLAGQYALPFICIALYYVTKYHFNKCHAKSYELIIIGICFAAVFWIKANYCAFFIPMIIVTATVLIREKKYKTLLHASSFILIGIIIFSIPIITYLIYHDIFILAIDGAYLNVLSGFEPLSRSTKIQNVFGMIKEASKTGFIYIALVFIISYVTCRSKKIIKNQALINMLDISFWGLIINLWASTINGYPWMHYFTTFTAIIVIPATWIFHLIHKHFTDIIKSQNKFILSNLVVCVIVLFISFNGLFLMVENIIFFPGNRGLPNHAPIVEFVLTNSNPDDLVQIIGDGHTSVNWRARRLNASRHINFTDGNYTKEYEKIIAKEIAEDIRIKIPKLLLFTPDRYEQFKSLVTEFNVGEFLSNYYEQQEVDFNLIVYKRLP